MPRFTITNQYQQLKKGGRRRKEDEDEEYLSPAEEQKRSLRRERNKVAAAKCRQRRLDTIAELSKQVAELQNTNGELLSHVDQLKKEKSELEFVLNLHESVCTLRRSKDQRPSCTQHSTRDEQHRPGTLNFLSPEDAILDVHTGLTPGGQWNALTPVFSGIDSMNHFADHHNLVPLVEIGSNE